MSETIATVHSLFPIPVGSYAGFSKERELKEYMLDLINKNGSRENTSNKGLHHYFDNIDRGVLFLEEFLIDSLKSWILSCSQHFAEEIQGYSCSKLQIISSWLNYSDSDAVQSPHYHENSLISGTYYISFEEGHAPISFWKPHSYSEPNRPYISLQRNSVQNIFNNNEVKISPIEGNLLLWPSHLLHGHSGNTKPGRISLSFNVLPSIIKGSSYSFEISPTTFK